MAPKKITGETITIMTRIYKPTHLNKRELREKIKGITHHVTMLGASGLEYCNSIYGHANPDPDREFIEIVIPVDKTTLNMRPNNKIMPVIGEVSDGESEVSGEDVEAPQESIQALGDRAFGESALTAGVPSAKDHNDDDNEEALKTTRPSRKAATPKDIAPKAAVIKATVPHTIGTKDTTRKATRSKVTFPKVAVPKATVSKVAVPLGSPLSAPLSVKKASTKPTIKLTVKSKGMTTTEPPVETTAPPLATSSSHKATTSDMQINPASLHAAGKDGQFEAPVLPSMNSETLEMARKGKAKAKVTVALPGDSEDEPIQMTRKAKRKVQEILEESDGESVKRSRRGKRMVAVHDESEDDKPVERIRKTRRKLQYSDESGDEPIEKAGKVDVAPASPVKAFRRTTRNSVKNSVVSYKTAADVKSSIPIKKTRARKATSKSASSASAPVDPITTGNIPQATLTAPTLTATTTANTATATANNMIVNNVGNFSTALPFKQPFKRNDPRPLGFLLPTNSAHTTFKFKAYPGAPVDFSDKDDLARINKFRNQEIRRTTAKLGTYQDGRQ